LSELIAAILDFLNGPDLIRFARTSRRMRDMVYDDTRWVQKLRAMGCWNEAEARRRFEEMRRKKMEAQRGRETEEAQRTGAYMHGGTNGFPRGDTINETLFDAGIEEIQQKTSLEFSRKSTGNPMVDGFSAITLSPTEPRRTSLQSSGKLDDVLLVVSRVRSVRGQARQEYGKIHRALAPYYFDLLITPAHNDTAVFRSFTMPEQQAKMLSQLKLFTQADTAEGAQLREERIDAVIDTFEGAALREFDQGILAEDIDGDMKRFAGVLVTLNGGTSAIDKFVQRSSIISNKLALGRPTDALSGVSSDNINMQASADFFGRLASALNDQGPIIDRTFPTSVDALFPLITRAVDDVVSTYLDTLFREARSRTLECYLKAVSNALDQANNFARALKPSAASNGDFSAQVLKLVFQCFRPHTNPYLEKELEYFRMKCDAEVKAWERQRSELEASTESMFMSNVTRQAAKSDFLKSFRKVVMMPVNALPTMSSPFTTSKSNARPTSYTGGYTGGNLEPPSRNSSPLPSPSTPGTRPASPSQRSEPLPTTELAAKAAIMNSKLEGIRSLFSIEVALNLSHTAKSSIERLTVFATVEPGSESALKAREECETIFVSLLKVLGSRHVKGGFDKAVEHLANYKPRDALHNNPQSPTTSSTSDSTNTVGPLITFLELVNVGDLIQQMITVFFMQELCAARLVDPDDFLSPAVKEKKRFEQMLDERVAAGLNKGIDVLMEEVELICATTQKQTDFNPGVDGSDPAQAMTDIGPTTTAKNVVSVLERHTGMLVGSTDKNVLDVFNQEVGQRLFTVLCKHLKRQRISVDGAIKLIR
jgi:recyclin-1